MGRRAVVERVAGMVPAHGAGRAVRVAVDGVDGAGKTTFADELAAALTGRGRTVVRATVDHFHHPAEIRHRRGRDSPDGFWLDSYDYPRLAALLLDPLGPGGCGPVRTGWYDGRVGAPVEVAPVRVPRDAVLVLDGIFLHRDELVAHWDFSVFLHVDFAVSVPRMAARDGTPPDPEHPAQARYVRGQRRYLAACDPAARAHVVIDNTRPDAPGVVRTRG